jgi:AcrR family transcriptional regulator
MSTFRKRPYVSEQREATARRNRERVLESARLLFAKRGIEGVRIDDIAHAAGVSASMIYATFKSREGILRALMENALFGPHYAAALALLDSEADPIELIALTAGVARAIYEEETRELGLIREIAAYSPTLRAIEKEFDDIRYEAQHQRIRDLFASKRARKGLELNAARRILWMYTSREVYRMLVTEGRWTPDEYEAWLRETLLTALVGPRTGSSR